jgi:predicted Mrr-cat superfamily restriction endonuclease
MVDHIVPRSIGGPDSVENLIVVCDSCNVRMVRTRPTEIATLRQEASEAYELEQVVTDLLSAAGYGLLTNATGPDGAMDIVARRREPNGHRIQLLVECKSGSEPLSSSDIASFGAKVLHYGFGYGLVVSSRQLTRAAEEQARSLGVRVLPIAEVPDFISELAGVSGE